MRRRSTPAATGGLRRRVQHQKCGRLMGGEMSRRHGILTDHGAFGDDKADRAGLRRSGSSSRAPKIVVVASNPGKRGNSHGDPQQLRPLLGGIRPPARHHESLECAARMKWSDLDRSTGARLHLALHDPGIRWPTSPTRPLGRSAQHGPATPGAQDDTTPALTADFGSHCPARRGRNPQRIRVRTRENRRRPRARGLSDRASNIAPCGREP